MSIKQQSEKIFLQFYEWENEVNCNGILPEKNDSKEYLIAKQSALNYAYTNDFNVYKYILHNL
jgi:hypothetical protein